MHTSSSPKWWHRRRVQWPAGVILSLTVACGLAIARSGPSRVIVFNDSGADIEELSVSACGDSRTFGSVGPRMSVRMTLTGTGSPGDITVITNGVMMWRGDHLEPWGGYRAFVHLRRDGQVETFTTVSWWRRLLTAATDPSL